ncbi:FtsX-like permease family [uncultured Ruminococcus sp.]|nr:FtsX-like permease family [uncultured Ruminococcus sp.]SCH33444.1 FtsX-like permease family [uncultured Clostridium sp.]
MKHGFYPKLAMTGISKNRKTYIPYILTCIGMVMMYYIVSFLSVNDSVRDLRGGNEMQMILQMGCGVIGFFSLVFLFYTNSFLMRRRKKEFGLYNILGMGKWNLARILFFECLIIAVIALAAGLFCGIMFSKIAELVMIHILQGEVNFSFSIDFSVIVQTVSVFCLIFLLIFLNALRQIRLANPVELLRSETVGEKPPRVNWVFALLGLIILAGAYYLAVSIKDPMSALIWFFVAVIMVIIATYLLFIAGSVALCRILQKNKRYYYKTNHFVSVSSMVYRMKRNGAGLASICILSTMVLVMLSSTVCLYLGAEDSMRSRYPRNVVVDTSSVESQSVKAVHGAIAEALKKYNVTEENLLHYRYLDVGGYFQEDQVIFDQNSLSGWELADTENIRQLFVVPLEDYNRLMGKEETLAENEVMIYNTKGSEYLYDTITLQGGGTWNVKKVIPDFVDNGTDAMQIISTLYLFVPDLEAMEQIFDAQAEIYGDNRSYKHDYYGFDLSCDDETQLLLTGTLRESIQQLGEDEAFPKVTVEGVAEERTGFYALYGGLFFLGVLLGIVFILGAVLIMYYKQITEGYEDQKRFEILQKVGMTKKEIKKSVNSQVLTVFFLPLIAAGVHVGFAFPLIHKLLALFSLTNTWLLIGITVGSYLLFALFYVVVYLITSKSYYGIVSRKES